MYYQPDSSESNQYQPQSTGSNQYQPPFNNQPTQQGGYPGSYSGSYPGSYSHNAAPNSANQQSSTGHFDDQYYHSQYPPTFAGQFGYPSAPPPKKGIWNWYRGQKKGAQIGIGCGAIFLVLLLCLCSASAMANGQSPAKTASSATATPTTFVQTGGATPTVTALSTPTSIPSTATPVPPTAIPPTPTLVPAAAVPTRAPVPTPTPTRAPQLSVAITSASAVNKSNGSVSVHTLPGAALTIKVRYCTGAYATSGSLKGTVSADGNGDYTWTWQPDTKCAGVATATVTASLHGQTASASRNFTVQ